MLFRPMAASATSTRPLPAAPFPATAVPVRWVFCLCGNNTKNPANAYFYLKNCYSWLNGSEHQNKTDFYSIFYPRSQPLSNSFVPNMKFNYKKLSKVLFEQLIKENGSVLSVDEISERFNNIIFFGHSMGGYIMNELMLNFKQIMIKEGFTNEDIKKVFSSIMFIGYSPFSLVEEPINRVYITPMFDSFGSTKLAYDELNKNKKFVSTVNKLNVDEIVKLRETSKSSFVKNYRKHINNDATAYLLSDNLLFSTPDLLLDDGLMKTITLLVL